MLEVTGDAAEAKGVPAQGREGVGVHLAADEAHMAVVEAKGGRGAQVHGRHGRASRPAPPMPLALSSLVNHLCPCCCPLRGERIRLCITWGYFYNFL